METETQFFITKNSAFNTINHFCFSFLLFFVKNSFIKSLPIFLKKINNTFETMTCPCLYQELVQEAKQGTKDVTLGPLGETETIIDTTNKKPQNI